MPDAIDGIPRPGPAADGPTPRQCPHDDAVSQALLARTTDGVFVAQDGRFVFANDALASMLGYAHAKLLGCDVTSVIAPGCLDAWHALCHPLTGNNAEAGVHCELSLLRRDGRHELPVELTHHPILFDGHAGMLGIVRDVSRWRRAERVLRDSEQRFRGTFEQAAVGIAMLDLDGRWRRVNRKLCDILGYGARELRRLTTWDVTHPDDMQAERDHMQRMLDGHVASCALEKRYIRKSGPVMWARLSLSMTRTPDKHPSHVIAVIEDIHERRMAQRALADSELRYRLLTHNLHAGIIICAPDARIVYGNPEASRLLHVDSAQMINRTMAQLGCDMFDESGAPLAEEDDAVRRVLESGRVVADLLIGIRVAHDTAPAWLLVHAYPEFDTAHRLRQIVVMLIDITDRRRLEVELEANRRLKATALDATTAHIAVLDSRGFVVESNASWQAYARRGGYGKDPSFGGINYLDALDQVTGDDTPQAQASRDGILSVMRGHTPLFEMDYACHAPTQRQWFSLKVTPMDPQRERVLVSHENITRSKLAEEAMVALANTDALTGLSNRRRFFEIADDEFARALRYATPLAVLMMDLDHFKSVNDRHGHAGGDAVLRSFAEVLSGLLRDSDHAGRIGGEEFAVLLPHTALDGAQAFAERVMECVAANPPDLGGGKVAPYTLSIGISTLSPSCKDFSALLRLADDALYRAKRRGRNRLETHARPAEPGNPPP
jgi:diguanylate cyclase (GGDEF)-like protein/PAS domain S-box-containing protein